jgi:hypothetical protein
LTIGLAALIGLLTINKWKADSPRRLSVATLRTLETALGGGDGQAVLQCVVVPSAFQTRSPFEQAEFFTRALRDELSIEGIQALAREGRFGSLQQIFPDEAITWATQSGVNPETCVAFKMDHNGTRAEVAFVRSGKELRIIRCNNVKQMAQKL